ncbi:MAG: ATP-binding protein [Alphaproteobacteria bacterium]
MISLKIVLLSFFIYSSFLCASIDTQSLEELFISETKKAIETSLIELKHAINSRNAQECSECTAALHGAINAAFPSGANIDSSIRSYLHDIRHHLALLTNSFTEQNPLELENIQASGIQVLSHLIPKICHGNQQSSSFSSEKISTLVESTLHLSSYHAKQNGVQFIYQPCAQLEKFIVTDENVYLAIRRVLFNLLHNAVHYTSKQPEQRKVILRTTIDDTTSIKSSYALFIITDSGVGISLDDFKKLFTQGFRGSQATTYTGSGTGLAACKTLVEEIGGEIHAISLGINRGSCFWFRAPALLDETAITATTTVIVRKRIAPRSMKILIVDDNRVIRRGLKKTIKDSITGISDGNIVEIASGEIALKENISEYDLIFMDQELGVENMSGLETTEKIRAQNINQPLIISISGNTDNASMTASLAAGINDFFPKGEKSKALGILLGKYFHFEV